MNINALEIETSHYMANDKERKMTNISARACVCNIQLIQIIMLLCLSFLSELAQLVIESNIIKQKIIK